MTSETPYPPGFRAFARKTKPALSIAACLSALLAPGAALAEDSPGSLFIDAIRDGHLLLDVRARYEFVDQDGLQRNANAYTIRTRFGYETAPIFATKLLLEYDDIQALGNEKFNSTRNGKDAFPVVADPEVTELNRLQLTFDGLPLSRFIIGRQRVILDDHRFVGNVGFRQNEQTFNAALLSVAPVDDVTLTYAFVDQVNRIFGDGVPAGRFNGDTHLVNGAYESVIGKLTGYAYLIQVDEAPASSSQSYGVRLAGGQTISDVSFSYVGEYARQKDYKNNPGDFGLDFFHGGAGLAAWGFDVAVDFELLEGNGAEAFQTPLATLHKFQGWADVFLTTPADGIEDLYISAGYRTGPLGVFDSAALRVVYHDFDADRGGADFGEEWDATIEIAFWERFSFSVIYANYDAKTFATDREKVWVTLGFRY